MAGIFVVIGPAIQPLGNALGWQTSRPNADVKTMREQNEEIASETKGQDHMQKTKEERRF